MAVEYEKFQEDLQQKIYERLCTLEKVEYSDESVKMLDEVFNKTFGDWISRYDLAEVALPLVWWKEWINKAIRCLPRCELVVFFKYHSTLEWVEK